MAWVTVEQVAEALGGSDDPFLAPCTDAANQWAHDRRRKAGYSDDPDVSPGPRADLGVITYAIVLFRERGAVDSYAGFDEFSTGAVPAPTVAQVNRLLGIPRPQTDRLATDVSVRTGRVR